MAVKEALDAVNGVVISLEFAAMRVTTDSKGPSGLVSTEVTLLKSSKQNKSQEGVSVWCEARHTRHIRIRYLDVQRGSVFLSETLLELLGEQLRQLLANVAIVPILLRLLLGFLRR